MAAERDAMDAPENQVESPEGASRRDALKKIGVGAAVAWTLPVVASSPAFASGTDAPYPPGSCTVCNSNLVTNGQFSSALSSGWSGSGGWIRTYSTAPVLNPASVADQPDLLRISSGGGFDQVITIPGGCSELPFAFQFAALARRGTLTGTLSFYRNSLANPLGSPISLTRTEPWFSSNLQVLSTSGTLPSVNLADTILAQLTFSFSSSYGDFGAIDAVSFSIGC